MTMHITIMLRATVVALTLAAAMPASAQKTTNWKISNEPGTWMPWTFNVLAPSDLKILGLTQADVRAFETRLKQIAEVFRTSPVWNPPIGVNPVLNGSAFGPSGYSSAAKKSKSQPIAGTIMMGSFELSEEIRTTGGREQRERFVGDETSHIMIHVNWLPGGGGVNMLSDAEGAFYEQLVRTADIGGFPTYDGSLLVIAKNGRPLWTPVSRERFLKAFIAKRRPDAANAEKYLAEQQKLYEAFVDPAATAARQAKYKAAIDKMASKGATAVENERRYWERDEADTLAGLKRGASHDPKDSPFAGVIAGVKAAEDQLAAMPAAERAGPACVLEARNDPSGSGLVPLGTPKCVPIVETNPNFFDAKLPRSVPQIVTVKQFRTAENEWKKGRPGENRKGQLDL